MQGSKIIEAVPNFSTSDPDVIDNIVSAINDHDQTYVLHVDPDKDYNRTVITFSSTASSIVAASSDAITVATEEINMQTHHGVHPRIGSTDVFPLIPVQNISVQDTIRLAHELSENIGSNLQLPVYCYGHAALRQDRSTLSSIRRGQYEGLPNKLQVPDWKPDFGPTKFVAKSGAVVVGVRPFLIAYNVNLTSTDREIAQQIARRIRTSGSQNKEGESVPGKLSLVQAMGVPLYRQDRGQFTQVSTNILNFRQGHSLHDVYQCTIEEAEALDTTVTGSEIVGLVPYQALLSSLQSIDPQVTTSNFSAKLDLLGLNDLYPFEIETKILDYKLRQFYDDFEGIEYFD